MARELAICGVSLVLAGCSFSDKAPPASATAIQPTKETAKLQAKLNFAQTKIDTIEVRIAALEKAQAEVPRDQTEIMWRTITVTNSGAVRVIKSISTPQPLSTYSSSKECMTAVKAYVSPQHIHANDLMSFVVQYPDRSEGTNYQCLPVGVDLRSH